MKPKPRITKGADGWMVERPGYGFAKTVDDGPYPTQGAALGSLTVRAGAAVASVERAATPAGTTDSWSYIKVAPFPLEIGLTPHTEPSTIKES